MAKNAKDSKDDSAQAGGIAKSFDQYEYVAVITPGAALLFGLYLVLQPKIPFSDLKDIGVGTFGAFLVAAYVTGHILRAVGDVLEWLCWRWRGMPSDWVLYKPQMGGLLSDQQRNDLINRVNNRNFDFETMQIKGDESRSEFRAKLEKWQAVTRQISIEVHDAKKGGRVDAFNRTYGMMVGITVALLITGVVLLFQNGIAAIGWTEPTKEGVAAFVVAGFSVYRTVRFGKYYARELFVSFLDLTKSEKTKKARHRKVKKPSAPKSKKKARKRRL